MSFQVLRVPLQSSSIAVLKRGKKIVPVIVLKN